MSLLQRVSARLCAQLRLWENTSEIASTTARPKCPIASPTGWRAARPSRAYQITWIEKTTKCPPILNPHRANLKSNSMATSSRTVHHPNGLISSPSLYHARVYNLKSDGIPRMELPGRPMGRRNCPYLGCDESGEPRRVGTQDVYLDGVDWRRDSHSQLHKVVVHNCHCDTDC